MSPQLTEDQTKAARFIANRNEEGMGARMPYAEMVVAADQLEALGLAEYRIDPPGSASRWLTPAGRAALSEPQP